MIAWQERQGGVTDGFGGVPGIYGSEVVLGTRREFHPEFKTKQAVHMLHEIKQCLDLGDNLRPMSEIKAAPPCHRHSHLRRHAKHVRIVLHKTPDAGQTCQRPGCLIPVHYTKLGHPDR